MNFGALVFVQGRTLLEMVRIESESRHMHNCIKSIE